MLPEAFAQRIQIQLGEEYPAFLAALDRPRAVAIRFNPLKCDNTPDLPFGLVILSSADIVAGESYTITVGQASGTFEAN